MFVSFTPDSRSLKILTCSIESRVGGFVFTGNTLL